MSRKAREWGSSSQKDGGGGGATSLLGRKMNWIQVGGPGLFVGYERLQSLNV